MIARRTYIFILLLVGPALCRAAAAPDTLTSAQYRSEIDRLLTVTQQLSSSQNHVPSSLYALPDQWHVHAGQKDFDVPTEGLRRDIRHYETNKSADNALAIQRQLLAYRAEIDGYENVPVDTSDARAKLASILAAREFHGVSGPGWSDRFKQWLIEQLVRLLRHLFHASAIPNISKYLVYALIAAALLTLIYIAYRILWRSTEMEQLIPRDLPVSAKEWTIWLAEARAAANKGDWRDAIHLAYWAGISFLESQGFWKPDRARTPREYLRLFTGTGEHRDTLVSLTRIFELAWYAKRDASETTFTEALAALEKLGCQ